MGLNSFLAAGVVSLSGVLAAAPVLAGSYQALCGGTRCTVNVSATEISSPFGSIPTTRVTNWGGGGDSNTSVGTGVATTVLFGPIGLLGFLAKNHDFNFLVNGYNEDGKKTSIQVQFKNDKPARRFVSEMSAVTGLGMGQKRSAAEIKKLESEQGLNDFDTAGGGSGLTLDQAAAKENQLANEQAEVAKASSTGKCWSSYLESNPGMKAWAEANPSMAESTKAKYDDC
tara:strand:- start:66 stop:749 length:684 start_codon:yes stop_codon:yes gene_type:complete